MNEKLRVEIRKSLVEMLSTNYQKKWRDTLNEAVIDIVKTDTQHNVVEFMGYFAQTINAVHGEASKGNNILTNESLEFFRTIRKVFKALLAKKTLSGVANGKVFETMASGTDIFVKIVEIWRFFNTSLKGMVDGTTPVNDENILTAFVKFSRILDAVLLLLIDTAKPEQVESE